MTYNPGIEMELSDMPAWVKEQVAVHVKHKRNLVCRIHPVEETVSIGATWHDNARQVIIARNVQGETETIRGGYYDSILNFSAEEMTGHQGGKTVLPIDAQVLRLCIFYKLNNVDLYIRRDGPHMVLVNGLGDGTELSQVQMNVLALHLNLTSAGRKAEMGRYHIYQSLVNIVTLELQDMGYLKVSKNGAVRKTIEGKRMNDTCRNRREWTWYQWGDHYDYHTRKFTGFPAEILDEYRVRMIEDIKRRRS